MSANSFILFLFADAHKILRGEARRRALPDVEVRSRRDATPISRKLSCRTADGKHISSHAMMRSSRALARRLHAARSSFFFEPWHQRRDQPRE